MSDPMLVQLTTAELRALVREAVVDALGELEGLAANRPPALLGRAELAKALGVGPSTLDRLRADGLPELRVGDAPRFELAAALSWIREHKALAGPAGGHEAETAENKPLRRATG